jgi:DNA polymerase elongation subunit (family B)
VADLLVSQRLSRELDSYKTPLPAARAARQLVEMGKAVAPGQVIRFVYTRGKPGVWAYGCGEFDQRTLDVDQYSVLLERAVRTILDSLTSKDLNGKILKFPFLGSITIVGHILD